MTRAGAAARKAFRHKIVTSWPSWTREEESARPSWPVPPAKIMLNAAVLSAVRSSSSSRFSNFIILDFSSKVCASSSAMRMSKSKSF